MLCQRGSNKIDHGEYTGRERGMYLREISIKQSK